MTLSAIAIDDEPKALEVVSMHAAKVLFLDLKATFTNAFEAIPYLNQHKIDVIFLDIKMPDISGIELVGCLQKVPMVVFTTAYSEYAVKGFELDAIDYLLKPFSLARFAKTCNKVLEIKQLRGIAVRDFIFVKTGYEEEKVMLEDILFIESEGNYLTLVLKNAKIISSQTMSDILQILPESQFMRVHRSYIIAVNKIEKITRNSLWIAGNEISIGASFEDKLLAIKEKYI